MSTDKTPPTIRVATLREVLAAIEDPEQRKGAAAFYNMGSSLGWEAARDIVRLMLATAECQRCNGTGIDPKHSTPDITTPGEEQPGALEPCLGCQVPPPATGIRCIRCGDSDGPFQTDYVGDWFCENCARVVNL